MGEAPDLTVKLAPAVLYPSPPSYQLTCGFALGDGRCYPLIRVGRVKSRAAATVTQEGGMK
jgi:hypothetical protein